LFYYKKALKYGYETNMIRNTKLHENKILPNFDG